MDKANAAIEAFLPHFKVLERVEDVPEGEEPATVRWRDQGLTDQQWDAMEQDFGPMMWAADYQEGGLCCCKETTVDSHPVWTANRQMSQVAR